MAQPLRPLPFEIEKRLYSILGLTEHERRVLEFTRKGAIQTSSISFLGKIPPGSIAYIVKKLYQRELLVKVGEGHKNTRWRSNLPAIFKEIKAMNLPSMTDWIGETSENI